MATTGSGATPRLGLVGVGAMGAPTATNMSARFGPRPVSDVAAPERVEIFERPADVERPARAS